MSTTKLNPPTGPIACQSWCERHDGHEGEMFAVDQVCMSRPGCVRLSMLDVDVTPEGVTSSELGVYLTDDHGTLSIGLDSGQIQSSLTMTADEAEMLVQILMDHVRILRESEAGN